MNEADRPDDDATGRDPPANRTPSRRRVPGPGLVIAIVTVLVAIAGFLILSRGTIAGSGDLRRELRDRGKIAIVGDLALERLGGPGADLVPADRDPAVRRALDGSDPAALAAALRRAGFRGVLADGRQPPQLRGEDWARATLRRRLAAYGSLPPLRAVHVAPAAALYVLEEPFTLEPRIESALAHVARRLLEGARAPRIQSFPEPLRRLRNVEVMVLLRQGDSPRLWRSARGSSIARALITAAVVARRRWTERQSAMGGPIDAALPTLDVEVAALLEDGTLGSTAPAFVDRAFTPVHGVAYERKGKWRYLLPDATQRHGRGSAVRAYARLFTDNGLETDSLDRSDLRLYRLVAMPLARSVAPESSPTGSLGGAGGGAAPAVDGTDEPVTDDAPAGD